MGRSETTVSDAFELILMWCDGFLVSQNFKKKNDHGGSHMVEMGGCVYLENEAMPGRETWAVDGPM